MKIFIGTDHRGVEVQNQIANYLNELGVEVIISSIKHTDADDYPDFAFDVCKSVLENKDSFGILICGTGIGMSIAANKVKGIRAARCINTDDAYFARCHNDANVLCISSNNSISELYQIVDSFLNTQGATEERHLKRIEKIIKYENGEYNEL